MQIEVLGERYQLQDPIGRGGMATIYRGHDMRMDRSVAIKVLREVYSTDPKFVTRFQREAKASSALQHPNIVQVYDYGHSDGNYFIVMELIEGTDLRRYLRSRGVLAVDRAMIIARDVALGLGAAHRRNIVHRDVKPQNVLVGRDGAIKLTDFGIASVYQDINAERLTTTGMTLGTVQYYAPEQAQGEIVSPAADVYALGIVMYEMLTGRTPFEGDTPVAVAMQHIQDPPAPPSRLNPEIPPGLESVIMRCLEKSPDMRFRDGNVLADALEALADEMGGNLPNEMAAGAGVRRAETINSPQYQVPQRPGAAALVEGAAAASSLGNGGTPMPYGVGNVATNGMSNAPANQFAPPQMAENAGAMTEIAQPARYNATTRNGAGSLYSQNQNKSETRFAGVITALILVATLLLLGFSVFLAINLFGGSTANKNNADMVTVPDLRGKDDQAAKVEAQNSGLVFQIENEDKVPHGIVTKQSLDPGSSVQRGKTIVVTLTLKVPDGLVNSTLNSAEMKLNNMGINYVAVSNSGGTPQLTDIVVSTSPTAGMPLQEGQKVTLYVMSSATPTATNTPAPNNTPVPSPTPTQPSPTPTQPSPTPVPSPTAVPTPKK